MRQSYPLFLALALAAPACEKPAPEAPPTTAAAPTLPQTAGPPEPAEPPAAAKWEPIAADALTDADKLLVERGTRAQQALGGQLVGALTHAAERDGFPASIAFCRGEAPNVAQKVADEHKVKIGRTSHKLRNPENKPPTWAAEAVAAAQPGQLFFRSPAGGLGMLSPIVAGELCMNCHGTPDKLAEGVPDAVAKLYPEDQATDFAPGDLRGWFWVEVQ